MRSQLRSISKDNQTIAEYIQNIKRLVDKLALLGDPLSAEYITDKILDGLGLNSPYQSVIEGVQNRDTPITFEALHEKLLNKKLSLQIQQNQQHLQSFSSFPATANITQTRWAGTKNPNHTNASFKRPPHQNKSSFEPLQPPKHYKPYEGKCQWCNVKGHVLTYCPTFRELHPNISVPPRPSHFTPTPQANAAVVAPSPSQAWLFDSGASHHVTTDLNNLSLHSPYDGTDEIATGDGSGLPISHSGSTHLFSQNHSFKLSNVLYVPKMHHNILSVYQFCLDNNVNIEFSSSSFFIKDNKSGATLLQGPCANEVYKWQSSSSSKLTAHLHSRAIDWHHRLGHPSQVILNKILSSVSCHHVFSSHCNSCLINKSHKLPFSTSSLSSNSPLEVIYSDVWSSPISSFDNYKYYVMFVDHYTKYTWLYPMQHKSDTLNIFIAFKRLVEKKFNHTIKTLYSDNGGEFQKLRPIAHLTSPPHTPEHNDYAERGHLHIVETALSLFTHASMPLYFWSSAVLTATYLINRMPTPTLQYQTSYFKLFGQNPNYKHLHNFGCLCYPWLRPYGSHKLSPKSTACVFIGYSPDQHAYLCLDPSTTRIYTSRHVRFVENVYPFASLSCTSFNSTNTLFEWCTIQVPVPPPPNSYTPTSTGSPSNNSSLLNNHPTNNIPTPSTSSAPTSNPTQSNNTQASNKFFKPI